MLLFILRRIGLALITLLILSVIVFAMTQALPGNIGRNVLGGFAPDSTVKAFNHQIGVDRPLIVQYADWLGHLLRGDLGESYAFKVPVSTLLGPALSHSLRLAALGFVLVVPLSIIGGVIAALRFGRAADRAITLTGRMFSVLPEFVTAAVLIVVVGILLGWLPVSAQWPPGAGPLTQIKYLLMPALVLVFVLFGYIQSMARAGTLEALDSDYVRTAYLKGLDRRQVVWRHVLRNGLLPTIAVIATQMGYLIGGLVIVEKAFNYPGVGQVLLQAVSNKDYPVLQAGVMIIGTVYLFATAAADLLYSLLNPRIRFAAAT